jgi:cathepsin C
VEKFASEQYLATELQYPYEAITGNCRRPEFGQKTFSAKNYRYVGGAYGLSSEREIMAEIY